MDQVSVEQLYRTRAADLATQLARQFPCQRDLAPDAVQHAFSRLAECTQPVHDPGGWVARTASNYMIDQLRKDSRLVHESEDFSLEYLASSSPTSDEDEERSRAVAAMRRALEEMGEPARSMLVLKYLHGCDYAQIADALGLPRGSIGTTLLRARRKLRDLVMTHGVTSSAA